MGTKIQLDHKNRERNCTSTNFICAINKFSKKQQQTQLYPQKETQPGDHLGTNSTF